MSLQSNRNISKKFITAIRQGSYLAAVLALLLVLPQGYGQTVGTRTALRVSSTDGKTTLSVTVKNPSGEAVTDGSVSFMSGGVSLGSAFVENGAATLTLDKLPANTKQITAVYLGSDQYAASASGSEQVQANATTAPPDFSIAANPTSLSLNAGEYGTSILTVTPENGFSQSVTLSLSGLPIATTKTFTPQVVVPSSGTLTSTLQIQTTANSTSTSASNEAVARHLAHAILFPGVMALAGIGAFRKRHSGVFRMLGIALLLLASVSGLTACSQRYSYLHHPPTANTGTPLGSYPITITAYSNNGGEVTSHSLAFTLVVK
ncbi:Ig-like domain-containing protein [Acidobacterium sp. S8]|uniref:Ig-like domain-containing protein n=1 Tax=Acidobacterium sp. S8 TaxID=1641854 RepID=UPI00131B05E4|nr:Ig-like domain-containing protein [Acidobacterium sp. S8]